LNPLGLVGLVLILFVIGLFIYDDMGKPEVEEILQGASVSRLNDIQETINCYTETHEFACGQVIYQTNQDVIKEEVEIIEVIEEQDVEITDENGNTTIVTQNVTTTKSIPKVSAADIEYLDKQTGNYMVCQRGHQCIIEAEIELYNEISQYVQAPYLYQLTITCDWREWCDEKRTKNTSPGTVTDSNGGVEYSWTTTSNDILGEYEIILNIRSAVNDYNGVPVTLEQKLVMVLIS
jgi:hypothetical protein